MLITLFGLTTAVTLVVSIPLYVDAVHHSILLNKLEKHTAGGQGLPYSFRFEFYGLWSPRNQWQDVQPLDKFLTDSSSKILNMPLLRIGRFVKTDFFKVSQTPQTEGNLDLERSTRMVSMGFLDDIAENITLIDGNIPDIANPGQDSVIEVLVSQAFANEYGIQVGEEFYLTPIKRREQENNQPISFPVRISGVWLPKNPRDIYWFIDPASLDDVFLVPMQSFTERISPDYNRDVSSATWHLVLDGTKVNSDQVSQLLSNIEVFEERANQFLPNFRMIRSPVNDLKSFQNSAQSLMNLMYAFAIPIIALILLFILLLASLSIERRRNEIAVLRSRGATGWQVLGTILLEAFILSLMAVVLSFPLGALVTQAVGLSRTFMDFSARTSLTVRISEAALIVGFITVVFITLVSIIPAIPAVRYTIISYKQERARRLKNPFWQRIWLDVFLLIPALYGSYLLWRRGSVNVEGITDPLNDPLLYLVPSLLVFSLSLIFLRIFPGILNLLSRVLERTRSIGILLATRQLSRNRGYEIPLIILILTLSLSIYTASLARTLDQDLVARTNYQTGSDVRFIKVGRDIPRSFQGPETASSNNSESLTFPVSEYLKIPGVSDATRVGYYSLDIRPLAGQRSSGVFIGIERLDFPRLTYWRDDFAVAPLQYLLNSLGAVPEGVLVNQQFLAQTGIKEGDPVELAIYTDLGRIVFQSRIVGSFEYFPTWYKDEDGPLFVGNLDYIFDHAGGYTPYQVWVKTDQNFDYGNIRDIQISDFNLQVLSWLAADPKIKEVQERPEQQGIFGFLFIGYLSAAVMTVVGFLLYALYSFQWRYVEFGVLRASGLSRKQMAATIAFELLCLILIGALAGTILGLITSRFYIPYMQVGDAPIDYTPPFNVLIAWESIGYIYLLFGLLFTVSLVILLYLLQRMKVFQAIKLGESL